MKYIILIGILGIIFLIYRKVSKYLDTGAKILLTVLPVSVILDMLTSNIPYNELLVVTVCVIIMTSILDSENEEERSKLWIYYQK